MQNPTYYISVDIEGMSGFGAGSGTEFDQILLREHITATAAGLKDGGAGRLQVKSFHGMPNGLPEYLEQIPSTSWDDPDLPSIASDCKGLILLGFHGLEPECAFGHSYHHPYLMLNGERVGEITVQIYLAASKGIPTILIAGDGHAVLEANRICGSIGSVNIRKGIKKNEGDMDRRILAGIREAALLAAQSSVPIQSCLRIFAWKSPCDPGRRPYCWKERAMAPGETATRYRTKHPVLGTSIDFSPIPSKPPLKPQRQDSRPVPGPLPLLLGKVFFFAGTASHNPLLYLFRHETKNGIFQNQVYP